MAGKHICGIWLMMMELWLTSLGEHATSNVVIKMDPKMVYPGVTQAVTMTCSMGSAEAAGGSLTVIMMQIKWARYTQNNKGGENSKEKKAKKGGDQKGEEILLAGVTFLEGVKLHAKQDGDGEDDKRMKVEGDLQKGRLVLTIRSPGLDDLGVYTCHASALDEAYKIVMFTASANLSVLGEEGSTALLLAQQERLNIYQKRAERERVVLEEKVRQLLDSKEKLGARVQSLEAKTQSLSTQLQKFRSSQSLGRSQTTALVAPLGKKSKNPIATGEFQKLSKRLDALEQQTVKEISQQVTQLKSEDFKSLRDRLDQLEGHRLSEMEVTMTKTGTLAVDNKQRIDEIQATYFTDMKTECYVCGEYEKNIPCTSEQLINRETADCPPNDGYCLNDIVQTMDGSRKIYKRCVSKEECMSQSKESTDRCAVFSFLTPGPLICHFCCSTNKCNLKMKPDKLYQQ